MTTNHKLAVGCSMALLLGGSIGGCLAIAKAAKLKGPTEFSTYLPLSVEPSPDHVPGTCAQFSQSVVFSVFDLPIPYSELAKQDPEKNGTSLAIVMRYLHRTIGARWHRDASLADLRASIDVGRPPIIDIDTHDGCAHFSTVVGYAVDRRQRLTHFYFYDPYFFERYPSPTPQSAVVPAADLARYWTRKWIEPGTRRPTRRHIHRVFLST